jgi:hypothetical protein
MLAVSRPLKMKKMKLTRKCRRYNVGIRCDGAASHNLITCEGGDQLAQLKVPQP